MNRRGRKARLAGVMGLLVGGGVMLGALASSATRDAWVWRAPPRIPVTDSPDSMAVDQASAGQGWARAAYDGGLRQCPKMNAEFLAACETEMKKLAARPEFAAGSYGGPLLITKMVPEQPDDGWDAQDRLERPREELRPASFELPPDSAPEHPAFTPTPDNYPAAPEAAVTADDISPPTPR
ncbi:hypothetical protein GON01_09255 [Sphingomonas sp. MAH-20]|uniref:Uncharacterized protein n=1 Tax=Sphingomonas horti TaxID=2682842 RepID=A0A6I4J0N7_9SPHN|nr:MULTISPECIES: hypothetical protein [Sphingomonas]MBA2919880.1 hypothetical protein [Sphingomonas sp. CGMCC 1.13658]MVO78119.1 hypothetical protein [Sphingomonas horti]